MSNGDSWQERGEALENGFFAKLDAELLAKLKVQAAAENDIAEISRVSGIKDERVLAALQQLGVSAPSFAAIRLFPLVAVAWADGILEKSERDAIEECVAKQSIDRDSPAMALLHHWLSQKPQEGAFEAWEVYAHGLVLEMSASEAHSLRDALVDEIKGVAESAGGLFGWGAISKGEHAILNRVETALTK